MMAKERPQRSFLLLMESLEDSTAGQSDQTDAYLSIANRLSGEEGRQFLPAVEKHFSRLGRAVLAHITSPNAELSQAALQTLGFCVYHSHVVSGVSETFLAEILSALCSLVMKSTEKNTCTRALWVISKQCFPQDVVAKKVPSILETLESVWANEDIQSVVMEHEALNVIIRMLEQVPPQMGDEAVRWAKLVIPLVVHSASKVRLRAAAAMEMGMPLLIKKQMEIAGVMEPMMASKLIPELQKLFMTKNETNVLKLWSLFVKLLGKLLHRGGPFINSLLHLEELGFRSPSPTVKKIAFIAWKSLIDNFALNPDILCSAKRLKLLMQPLTSINARTEALLLTKVEVWWYLVVQLGPNLSSNFDQVALPLLQCTIGSNSSSVPSTPVRAGAPNGAVTPSTPKTGPPGFSTPSSTTRMSLNSSVQLPSTFPSIQLLGLEMLLHYFLGPEVVSTAAKSKLVLSLESLKYPLVSAASSFTKHAAALISNIRDGVTTVGRDAPDSLLKLLWTNLVNFVNLTIESGSKKGCEVLTLMLQALQSIVLAETLSADIVLVLIETTVKGLPPKVLGSASYQVGKMDVLNGTPALFLILLLYNSSMLPVYIEDERFYQCLQTLVGCGLSGLTSPLAFGEAVLAAVSCSVTSVQKKEQLLRMWSVVVSPLTDMITQSNEVNQGDALEHNFSAVHSALMFPFPHLLSGTPLHQVAHKSMLSTWSKLYKVFARCSALVVTAEENICCEELCVKMAATLHRDTLMIPSTLNAVASILQVMVESADFSPFTPQFQQKLKSPHTPVNWMRKRNKSLGNLSTFQSLLVQCLEIYLENVEASPEATGVALISCLSALFSNLGLANSIQEALTSLTQPLTVLYEQAAADPAKLTPQILAKLEKLLSEMLVCLQSRSTLVFDDDLLALLSPLFCVLFPHKNKQHRIAVTHFWNATFANSVSLTYPEALRPVLSQVKEKTPIILPGFEVVGVPEELNGQYSSESSQLETKLSGMPVSSVGKKKTLLANDVQDRTTKTSKPVSTKLDFGSPKPPRREVLEEEASIDFVFIPPETKERVLTEHQKEMKRTKRVDIPAMYNNLDASLDTTVFSQYTQSQEDSMSRLPAEQGAEEALGKEAASTEDGADIQTSETQEDTSPKDAENMNEEPKVIPESADISLENATAAKESPRSDMSSSSDVLSGTPQRSGGSSRRQAFITLEKYTGGKSPTPGAASTFTRSLGKISSGQESCTDTQTPSSQKASTPDSLDSSSSKKGSLNSEGCLQDFQESPRRPKKSQPVRLTDRLPSDTTEDEDVIPDTQTEGEVLDGSKRMSMLNEMKSSDLEDDSKLSQDDSQASLTESEPRRSGRPRIKPLLPGEDADECDQKYVALKKRRSGSESKSGSPSSSTPQSRPTTRSQQDGGRNGVRTRAQKESSQTPSLVRSSRKIKLYSSLDELLLQPKRKRRHSKGRESSLSDQQSDTQSDYESQSQCSQSSLELEAEALSEDSRQTATQDVDQTIKDAKEPKTDSEMVTDSPQTAALSPVIATPPTGESQSGIKSTTPLVNESELQHEPTGDTDVITDSQVSTPSSSDSQSLCRPRRSKAASEELSEDNKVPSRRQSSSSSQLTVSTPHQSEARGGMTRRSQAHEEQAKSTPDSSQSVDSAGGSSQGRGRYSKRRSSQAANVESEPESVETRDTPQMPKKRGRKPKSLLSPPAKTSKGDSQLPPEEHSQSIDDSQNSQDSEPLDAQGPGGDQSSKEGMEVDAGASVPISVLPGKKRGKKRKSDKITDSQSSQESLTPGLESAEAVDISPEAVQENLPCDMPLAFSGTEKLHVSAPPEEQVAEVAEPCDVVTELEEEPVVSAEDALSVTLEQEKVVFPQEKSSEPPEATSLKESNYKDSKALGEPEEDEKSQTSNKENDLAAQNDTTESASNCVFHDSPGKQKDLEIVMMPDVVQSPCSGRTRGTWSPSASPSSSILKKGQKRQLEDKTPSPLVKSRRVSFANPIQRQETADDIDRRSPAVRTSSPRRFKTSSIPQPKHVTTPTKGLLVLSPRSLHSPGYKSSKKCLISEMSQEPRPVSRDCIYPPLVGCSTPVEAVLPQILSNIWSRGFGQLLRARSIKTVGDLSALTPTEIKTLPIHSPKILNVKKALKSYQDQRKGRRVDELKSFDETEMMTSELEETCAAQNQDEEKTSGETLATELVDEAVPVERRSEPDHPAHETAREPPRVDPPHPEGGLLAQCDALSQSMTQLGLNVCSPQQLVQMHDQLGGMMRRVVVELQTRLCEKDIQP